MERETKEHRAGGRKKVGDRERRRQRTGDIKRVGKGGTIQQEAERGREKGREMGKRWRGKKKEGEKRRPRGSEA